MEYIINLKFYRMSLEESYEVYNNDGTFNRLKIEDYEYDNLSIKEAQNLAKENIKNQYGNIYKNITSSNNITVDFRTKGEYIYSKYTKSRTPDIKYVKCMLSNYFKELFLNAHTKEYSCNKKPKHITDAKYGFYKYFTNFSIQYKEKEDIYNCYLLVRNDADGKKYLYDILGIKRLSNNTS